MSLIKSLAAGPPPRVRGWGGGSDSFSGGSVAAASGGAPTAVGAAYSVIQFISRTAGMLPGHVFKRGDKKRVEVRRPEFEHIWGRPNPSTTKLSFWETTFASIEAQGNGYVWKGRKQGARYNAARPWEGIEELWHLRPQRLSVGTSATDGAKAFKLDDQDDKPRTIEEIGHVPGVSFDGIRGVSPIEAGASAHGLYLMAERFGAMFFRNGSSLSGVLLSEAAHDPIKAKEIGDLWAEHYAGLSNAHKLAVIGGNAKYQRIGIPPNEAQFIETRLMQREEVLQYYGPVPHHLLGWKSNTSNFGTGVEQQGIHLVTYVLLNRLRRVEQWVDDELLPPDLYFKFSVKSLLEGDSKTQAAVLKTMRDSGVLSADRWLELLDMAPREIPDDYLYLGNPVRVSVDDPDPLKPRREPVVPQLPAPGAVPDPEEAGEDDEDPEARRVGAMAEALCPSCGARGKRSLLGKDVVSARLWCSSCKAERVVRAGAFLDPLDPARALDGPRDDGDFADYLTMELASRL